MAKRIDYGPRRRLRKRTLEESVSDQVHLGSAYNSANPPTKDTPMRDRAVNVNTRYVHDMEPTRYARPSTPTAKLAEYKLPPGPRGDSPSSAIDRRRRAGRTGDMRYGYATTEQAKRKERLRRARKLPAWHRDAARYD